MAQHLDGDPRTLKQIIADDPYYSQPDRFNAAVALVEQDQKAKLLKDFLSSSIDPQQLSWRQHFLLSCALDEIFPGLSRGIEQRRLTS